MAKRRKVGNMLALGLLALLVPGRPMHPYARSRRWTRCTESCGPAARP